MYLLVGVLNRIFVVTAYYTSQLSLTMIFLKIFGNVKLSPSHFQILTI